LIWISGVASQAIPTNSFTSTYRNYKIIISNLTSSVNSAQVRYRFRVAGVDNTSSEYVRLGFAAFSTTLQSESFTETSYYLGNTSSTSTVPSFAFIDLTNPQTTQRTGVSYTVFSAETTTAFSLLGFHILNGSSSAQFDAINIFPSSGNISGTIQVFAYNQ
jgi:hypothetical protein